MDAGRQAWNIAPGDRHSWTGLDSPPITTDLRVRARCVPDRMSTRGQPRSLADRQSRSLQVAESAGGRRAAPQTSQADSEVNGSWRLEATVRGASPSLHRGGKRHRRPAAAGFAARRHGETLAENASAKDHRHRRAVADFRDHTQWPGLQQTHSPGVGDRDRSSVDLWVDTLAADYILNKDRHRRHYSYPSHTRAITRG